MVQNGKMSMKGTFPMKKNILLIHSIFICALLAAPHICADENIDSTENINTQEITDNADTITRAVQTVVINNALIRGSATCKGNMGIDGLFTGTLRCNAVSGPAVSDSNQIATYADASGLQLASSVVSGGFVLFDVAELSADSAEFNTLTTYAGPVITQDVTCNQAIQEEIFAASAGSVTAGATTNTLILKQTPPASTSPFIINMPPSPQDGQLFTVINGGTTNIQKVQFNPSLANLPPSLVFPFTPQVLLSTTNPALTLMYYATTGLWYIAGR